jgi:aldehyde:ferredoxin oxidoreductase
MIAAATGWKDLSIDEEMAIGDRAYTLARAFTVRESGGKADDRLPAKLAKSLRDGASKDQVISDSDLKKALAEYYQLRGYDKNGTPTPAKLKELGIEDVAAKLAVTGAKGGAR